MNLRKQIDSVNKRLQLSVQNETSQASCDHSVEDTSIEQNREQLMKAAMSEVGTERTVKEAQMDCTSIRLIEDAPVSDEAGELVQNLSAISLKPNVSIKEYRATNFIGVTSK